MKKNLHGRINSLLPVNSHISNLEDKVVLLPGENLSCPEDSSVKFSVDIVLIHNLQ